MGKINSNCFKLLKLIFYNIDIKNVFLEYGFKFS